MEAKMANSSYQPGVYRKQGGNELVVASGGRITVESGGQISVLTPRGTIYFVDTAVAASGDGLSWAGAFKTMAEAIAVIVAGDTILFTGSILNEAVTITSKAGVSIIGVGTTTNQALWTSTVNDSVCLTLAGSADCLIENIRFRPPPGTSTNAPAAISLTGASHNVIIRGCRFQGKANSYYGILTDGAQSNVHILDNEFWYINTATYGTAIKGTGYASAEPAGWIIEGNKFHSNLNHLVCRLRQSIVRNNVFAAQGLAADGSTSATLTVLGIDIHGATGGCNIVTRNDLAGLYHQAHYYAGTNDEWSGNYCADRTHATQVDATTGISKVAPAA
jgi:hypothetical protein